MMIDNNNYRIQSSIYIYKCILQTNEDIILI